MKPSQVCFQNRCLSVEVADTEALRVRGLQGRTSMANDHGMLFIFAGQGVYNFWMKDTLIALDIVWIDDAAKIVDIKPQLPPCRENPCRVYKPAGPARYVLETNAGVIQTLGLKIGDAIEIK